MPISTRLWLIARIGEGADGGFAFLRCRKIVGAGDSRSAPGRGRRWRWLRRIWCGSSIDHAGQTAQSGLRDLAQYQVVRCRPGVTAAFAGRFLAGKAKGALLVLVVDVPDPGDGGASVVDLGGEIAFHPVGGGALPGHDRQAA